MNNSALTPLNGGKKLVLALIGVSLCAMLAASFVYRTKNPNLTEQGKPQTAAPAQQMDSADEHGAEDELTHLMALMKEDPNNLDVLKQITDFFIRNKDFGRAGFFAQKALIAAPSDPQVLYMNGIVQFNQGKSQEAVQTFETLITINDDPSARYNLGIIYKHFLKQPEKAKVHFEALLTHSKADEALKKRAQAELETDHK